MAKYSIRSGTVIDHTDDGWTEFKKWLNGTYTTLPYTWIEDTLTYTIIAPDNSITHTFSFNKTDETACQEFEASYKSRRVIDSRTVDGRLVAATSKPDGSRANFFTPNWCDKTTWYQKSTYVASEVLTDSGNHTTYSFAHQFVVDSYHGKITQEDFLKGPTGQNLRVTVKVNDITKTEQDPHYGSGGDYIINYAAGTITFLSALNADDEVTATYHYTNDSTFIIAPSANKTLVIDLAEVQLSTNVELLDSVRYNVFGYVDVFAPQLMLAPYNIPSGTKIPLANDFVYKTMSDYLNDSMRLYPQCPGVGTNWRGSPPSLVFDWDYLKSLPLSYKAGMEVRIWLEHHTPFGGNFATVTFYCGSVAE
jgi:hypothetical protein